VADLLREGDSLNTQLSYRSALRYWAAWEPFRRTSIARRPAFAWEQVLLPDAVPDLGPADRPESPRLVLPPEHCSHME